MNRSTPLRPPELPKNDEGIARSFESPDWYLKRFSANIRIRTETIATLTRGMSFDRILDIGCGDGSLSLPLLPRANHITFLDRSKAMLDHVASRLDGADLAKVKFVNAGFLDAVMEPKRFDLILCVGVLAYVQDVDEFLGKVCAFLQRGGMLILECTDSAHLFSRLERGYQTLTACLKQRQFITHSHNARDVVATAQTHGLCLHKTFRYAYGLPLVSRLFSGARTYRLIRRVYGHIDKNRHPALGNQFIFEFQYPSAQ